MAVIDSITIGKGRGSLGNVTLRLRSGQTIASQKLQKGVGGAVVRSFAQMQHRVPWANIVNLFRSFSGDLHPSFQVRGAGVSDFNMFVGKNIGSNEVWLEKEEANQGAAVVAPYIATMGTLSPIGVSTGTGGVSVSTISVGSDTFDPDSTTVAEMSQTIIDNNSGYQQGDKITYFKLLQVSDENGIPRVEVTARQLKLDLDDTDTLISDVWSGYDGFAYTNGHLAAAQTVNGGVFWVHSREQGGVYEVSTQRIFVTNTLLATYQTSAKQSSAILSYGGKLQTQFLRPYPTDDAAVEHV